MPDLMTDYFSLMGEARRPWLDVEALKGRFLESTSLVHPDRFHGAAELERVEAGNRYTELNTAHQVLRDVRQRLLHLIELETGARPRDIQRIPAGTMDLFVDVGQACRDADGFLERRGAVTSPMLKVKLFQEGMEWVERLKSMQARVRSRESVLEVDLRALNESWDAAGAVGSAGREARLPMDRLTDVYRGLSYVARWTEQLQERLVRLASV